MQVVIASESEDELRRYRAELLGRGNDCAATDLTPYGGLKLRLTRKPAAELAVVVLDPANEAGGLDAIRTARGFGVPVVAVGPEGHTPLIIQATRLGAKYVEAERFAQDFESVIEELKASGAVALTRGFCVAMTSPLPGCGVTTIASLLAHIWGRSSPGKVGLAEFGRDTPELALNLGVDVPHSVADLARDSAHMDTAMFLAALGPEKSGVRLLGSPPGTIAPSTIEPAVLRKLIVLLRTAFEYCVLDLGHGLYPSSIEAMGLSETVLVVTRVDVPAIRLTREYLRALSAAGISNSKIKVVANRYDQSGHLPWKQVQEALKHEPIAWVPDDPATVNDGLRVGMPVTDRSPRSGLIKRMTELTTKLGTPA